MPFYIRVPISNKGEAESTGKIAKVPIRAHASQLIYGEAVRFHAIAQKEWPELEWRIEPARTARYLIKGEERVTPKPKHEAKRT